MGNYFDRAARGVLNIYDSAWRGAIHVYKKLWNDINTIGQTPGAATPSQWHDASVFNQDITPLQQPETDTPPTTVIQREVVIYREPVVPDRIKNIPQTPPRRLPKVAGDGQTAFKTPIGQVITVQKSSQERDYGKLLFNPLIKRKEKVRQGKNDKLIDDINQSIEKGADRFYNWLSAQSDPIYANSPEYLDKKMNFFDASCLILPESIKAFDGKVGLLYGIDSLALISEYFSDLSINALMPVRDTLPTEYEVVNYKPPSNKTELTEQKDLEIVGDAQFTTVLAPRSSMWTKSRVTENWLRLDGSDQYKDEEEHRPGIIENLPDLVVSLLSSLYYRSGFHRYPAILPESLVDDVTKDKKRRPTEPLKALISDGLSLSEWAIRQIDAFMGVFPIRFKYKDDKDKEHEVEYPNISEALSEILAMGMGTSADSEATMAIALKTLAETTRASNNALLAHDYARGNAEYLGYKGNLKGREIKLSYDPKAEDIDGLLKTSKMQVQRWDNDDKDTLVEKVNRLVIAAGIIKAALQVEWKPGEDLPGDRIKRSREEQKKKEDETWNEFVNKLNNPQGIYKTKGLPTPYIDELKKGN